MKLIEHDGLRELQADEGKFLATADKSTVMGTSIYLGIYDKPENYIDVTAEEREAIIKAQAEARAEEEKKHFEHHRPLEDA